MRRRQGKAWLSRVFRGRRPQAVPFGGNNSWKDSAPRRIRRGSTGDEATKAALPRLTRREASLTITGAVGGAILGLVVGTASEFLGEGANRMIWTSPEPPGRQAREPVQSDPTPTPVSPNTLPVPCAPPDVTVESIVPERTSDNRVKVTFKAQQPPSGWYYWLLSKSDSADSWYPTHEPRWNGHRTYWADAIIEPGSDYRVYAFLVDQRARTSIQTYVDDRMRDGAWQSGLQYHAIAGCKVQKGVRRVPQKVNQTDGSARMASPTPNTSQSLLMPRAK